MRWVTLHVTAPTAAVVVARDRAVDVVVVAAAAALTCAATTATRLDTSLVTARQLHKALPSRPVGGLGWLLSNGSRQHADQRTDRTAHRPNS